MINCCVENFKKMHEQTNSFWWFQRFILASPFILILPDFDPTQGTNDLLQNGILKANEVSSQFATQLVRQRKSLPDFVDTVKAIGLMNYQRLSQTAMDHSNGHAIKAGLSGENKTLANFWSNLAKAYTAAFLGH